MAASVALGAAALMALAAAWGNPFFRYVRPGGGVRSNHPTLTGCPPIPHVIFIMRATTPPVEELLSGSAG